MKKYLPLLLLIILFSSCDFLPLKLFREEAPQSIDTIIADGPIDTLALTLDALRKKRIIPGYKMIDDVKTDMLIYSGFMMDDVPHFIFKDLAGEELIFNGNNTNFNLTIKSKNPNAENGGYDPNPRYLNKEFRVVWRKIQLIDNPKNEEQYYNQEVDEIIFLQEKTRFPDQSF